MSTEDRIDDKINNLLKPTKNAGFTKPPADYFERFADNLPIEKKKEVKTFAFSQFRSNWLQISSLAVAAVLLLALWVFVFNANIKSGTNTYFTVDDLMAINDFQNYNEDLIYSELALVSDEDILSVDEEMDALLEMDDLSADEIIELYSTEY
ncbi:MAG: hypothetical protein J7K39_12130 [Bacteroidales bacterium]|nr:hypothetical protein [Bacteroidales bacterium]